MALDATTRALIDAMSAAFPALGTDVNDAAEARRMLHESALARGDPPAVASVENRLIPGPPAAPEIPVRVYWPARAMTPTPLIVYFHGGGFVLCDLDSHDVGCRTLANGVGAIVVSVDYRLAPEHRFPAATEDAYVATRWAHDHAASLGADAHLLLVAGDSSGGNLAAVVALMARDRGGPPLSLQLLIYPITDHARETESRREKSDGYFLTDAHIRWFEHQYLGDSGDAAHPYASPARADLAGLPQAYVVTAEHDPLRDDGEEYARLLREAGVPATVRRYDGMFHGFFNLVDLLEGARAANQETFAAVRAELCAIHGTAREGRSCESR